MPAANPEITLAELDPLGAMGTLRFNHLHPPFDNVTRTSKAWSSARSSSSGVWRRVEAGATPSTHRRADFAKLSSPNRGGERWLTE
jgi:hypothetical protein